MSTDHRIEHLLGDLLADDAPARAPEQLRHHILFTTSRARPRSRWLADIKERPMRLHNRVAAGSPAMRLAYVLILTLLLAILATGTVVGGASLLPGPATIIVDQDGNGTVMTIGEAVAMAENGDTILISPGTYAESVVISRDIILRGDGPRDSIVLDFTATTTTTDIPYADRPLPYGILIDGGDAELVDLTIRGPIQGIGVQVLGGTPILDGLVIEIGDPALVRDESMPVGFFGGTGGTVRKSTLSGYIPVRGGSPQFIDNIITGSFSIDGPGAPVLRDNQFMADAGAGMSYGGSPLIENNEFNGGGIGVDTGSDPTIRRNRFRDASLGTGWTDCAAICLAQYQEIMSPEEVAALGVTTENLGEIRAVIEDNEITNARTAIAVKGDGATPSITRNTLRDNDVGVLIEGVSTATVQDNTLTRNALGISVAGGESVISRNQIRESSSVGLSISSGQPRLTGNRVESGKTGISLGGSAEPVMADNIVCGNEVDLARLGEPVAAVEGVMGCEGLPPPVP